MRSLLPLIVLSLAACSPRGGTDGAEGADGTEGGDGVDPTRDPGPCSLRANVEVVPLDAWGRDLTASVVASLEATGIEDDQAHDATWSARLGAEPVTVVLQLTAPDHAATSLELAWDGGDLDAGLDVTVLSGGGLLALGTETRTLGGARCPVRTAWIGLDHTWLANGGAPPSHNDVTLFTSGADYWGAVAESLESADDHVHWSTWWWESDFELLRTDSWRTVAQRRADTVIELLEARSSATKRVLVNQFWDPEVEATSLLNTDGDLRDRGERSGDDFEVMTQANPTEVPIFVPYQAPALSVDFAARVRANPRYADRTVEAEARPLPPPFLVDAASYHQKFLAIDGEVAFVSGMNTKLVDWDTPEHAVFDPRRSPIDTSRADWNAVADKEEAAASPPRKDYGVRLSGPIVHDVERLFARRWQLGLDAGARWSDAASAIELPERPAEVAGGALAQLVVTMPEPLGERSILETHLKAMRAAEHYVLLEDQYLRAPLVLNALIDRMFEVPELVVIAITQDVSSLDPAAQHTYIADTTMRQLFGDRYLLLQLRSADLTIDEGIIFDDPDPVFETISLHSKLRIVDDRYLSVGSCNFNNRGYLYEGEANVAVVDEAFVTEARRRVLAHLVGPDHAGRLGDDPVANLAVLAEVAAANQQTMDWWLDEGVDLSVSAAFAAWATDRPSGFVYPLRVDDDYVFDLGPDAF